MKSPRKLAGIAVLLLSALCATAAQAATPAAPSAALRAPMSDGEVKKIDKEAGKITLKHGPLANLDMPPMTMVFRVKDPAMLDQVKVGDKVSFVAEKVAGQLTVTHIEMLRL
ncbi:copper-binding protein [Janthinobacterium sp.]|uniref:copper-binding protein n=1 Tax=Janthinobacterium sp. TaxID=1871054 RepID=UPI00293D9588|nr:copper-binding protein [Janthinobacterium sp.]